MLHNKYFIAGLVALLVLVLGYNISFFSGRGKGSEHPPALPGASEQNARGITAPASPESGISGEWRRDPFWYPGGRTHGAAPAGKRSAGIHLEATMAEGGKPFAIINGDIVGIGERFNGYIVTEIGDQVVKLKGPGGIKTLKLAGDSNEKE